MQLRVPVAGDDGHVALALLEVSEHNIELFALAIDAAWYVGADDLEEQLVRLWAMRESYGSRREARMAEVAMNGDACCEAAVDLARADEDTVPISCIARTCQSTAESISDVFRRRRRGA